MRMTNAFLELDDLYRHLENTAAEYRHPQQIAAEFQVMRDRLFERGEKEDAEKAQWEMDCFNFDLVGAAVRPLFQKVYENGTSWDYPDLKRFDDRTYEYLVNRAEIARNPVLMSRYAHILWCSSKKHRKWAKLSVDSYLASIKLYKHMIAGTPSVDTGDKVEAAMRNAFEISKSSNYNEELVKSEMKRLVTNFSYESKWSCYLRHSLISIMLKYRRIFSEGDIQPLEMICWKVYESIKKSDPHATIDILQLGAQVAGRLGRKRDEWFMAIGEVYETLLTAAKKRGDYLTAQSYARSAFDAYRQANAVDKMNLLKESYDKLRSSLNFAHFSQEVDLSDHIERCNQAAAVISSKGPEKILKWMMSSPDLLPNPETVTALASEVSSKAPLQRDISKSVVDPLGHVVQHFCTEEELDQYQFFQVYRGILKLDKVHLFKAVLLDCIGHNTLSAEKAIDFLGQQTWFGKTISRPLPNGQVLQYKWLELIRPRMQEYFRKIQQYLLDRNIEPVYVPCLDSLVLKIEGLLRDMCYLSGISTSYMTKDNAGRSISLEKGLNFLLFEPAIKDALRADDWWFLRFLLIEQVGYNLRNEVAHALLWPMAYGFEMTSWVFLALLRLAKYYLE